MDSFKHGTRITILSLLLALASGCDGGSLELTGEPDGCLGDEQCGVGYVCGPEGTCVPSETLINIEVQPQPDVTAEVAEDTGGDTPCVPQGEWCDGLDNDCDGETDEELGTVTCGLGACEVTVEVCADGEVQTCTPGFPEIEVCDGLDNDCDGDVDDGLEDLSCGEGECAVTAPSCVDGAPVDCVAADPADEVCDGLDNDCDGDTDEAPEDGLPTLCDDGNLCTVDLCLGADGCAHEPLWGPECDGSDLCTVGVCEDGACVVEDVTCDDDSACTEDACDPGAGCVFTPIESPCDDGDPCTIGDACVEGACVGEAQDCECLSDQDCGDLEDGDLCNGTLYCDYSEMPFSCQVDPLSVVSCPEPDGIDADCLDADCDPETGLCSLPAVNEGGACDDLDACTEGDQCLAGACVGGGFPDCDDGNPCTTNTCEPLSGCTNSVNTAPCEDGDLCTDGDACVDCACVSGPAADCDDLDDCTADTCAPETGCAHDPLTGTSCEDGDPCTGPDLCDAGACVPGAALTCQDDNPCTDDACEPLSGCINLPNQDLCDDGDVCTDGDHCAQGFCVGDPLDCDDGDACTADSCAHPAGCAWEDVSAACADDEPCTEDSCDADLGCLNTPVADGGACPDGVCFEGACCTPWCTGKECGTDLCGGSCGDCDPGEECDLGLCVQAIPELTWVPVEGALYWMGCPTGICPDDDEYPSHAVAVQPFEILATEVTEGQYETAVGVNPSCAPAGEDHPVECVTRDEAEAFCETIGGRLPTEAEWELAHRGAAAAAFHCGAEEACLADTAWTAADAGGAKHPVAAKDASAQDLYDTAGNVREWVLDCYHFDYEGAPGVGFPEWRCACDGIRVARGGGFDDPAEECAASSRQQVADDVPSAADLGFRCVRCPACPEDPGGECPCIPQCDGKVCGDDGCEGSCGECTDPLDACVEGACVLTQPEEDCFVASYEGHVYAFCSPDPAVDWAEAAARCQTWGDAYLVALNSGAEDSWVNVTFGVSKYWVGFSDADQESYWVWSDGSTASSYQNWCGGEPNNAGSGEDCAEIGSQGCTNDAPCANPVPAYVCEDPGQ